ncbi:hypothetical protein C8A01DRAFT_37910 [Parachaetomium inaequale]|uniref:Uncharacterized protein n=1 Tax=Parachaetomium inaequale TaxID=2588326 RepID=A0AAN6PC29_9PEZI|nr:hypothetical protein C8A01DRAFT_37910 [Parachaetomium inaequale]
MRPSLLLSIVTLGGFAAAQEETYTYETAATAQETYTYETAATASEVASAVTTVSETSPLEPTPTETREATSTSTATATATVVPVAGANSLNVQAPVAGLAAVCALGMALL